jgi:hypothetical protein
MHATCSIASGPPVCCYYYYYYYEYCYYYYYYYNNLCNSVNYCKLLIFADNLKIFRVINSPHDCILLQSDINSVSG